MSLQVGDRVMMENPSTYEMELFEVVEIVRTQFGGFNVIWKRVNE